MAKRGRLKLGLEVIRLTVTLTVDEHNILSLEAINKKKSLARLIVDRALANQLPDEITKSALELLIQIADRCGGKVETSVMRSILSKQGEF